MSRDWSFAPDVVGAVDRLMQLDSPEDFVICSGQTHSLAELVSTVFGLLDLKVEDHLRIDKSLFRAKEPPIIRGSNAKARAMLDWRPTTSFHEMLKRMVACEMALHGFLHALAANWISAGVRLVPLGQTDGQRVLAALEPVIAATAKRSLATPLEDVGTCALRADIAGMRHETQYTRLFRS